MDFVDLVWHLAGFVAPALGVAGGVTLLAQAATRRTAPARLLWRRFLVNLAACLAVLVTGLVLTGQDGRMLTYAALVLACAAAQAWQTRRA